MMRTETQIDVSQWQGILVYIECQQGQIHAVSKELIGEAKRLSDQLQTKVYGIAIGENLEQVSQYLMGAPLSKLYLYDTTDTYIPEFYKASLLNCIQTCQPEIVLMGGTREGRALAPCVATACQTGLTADCTSFEINAERNLVQIRPAFGGNIMARIVTTKTRPQFATVRQGMMQPFQPCIENCEYQTLVEYRKVPTQRTSLTIVDIQQEQKKQDICSQNILVVAGRGVQKKEDLAILEELAHLLGGALASSRALVEKGWTRAEQQIGLSGNTVAPEYLLTFGVSGTVQFQAGMKQSKNIIAVNHDPNAAIFDIAHYPICADLYEVAEALIAQLKHKGR